MDGSFDQFVASDTRIEADDGSIEGPADVDGDVDLTYFSIAYWSEYSNDGASGGLDAGYYLGLAQTNFDLEMDSNGRTFEIDDSSVELYLQYVMSLYLQESLQAGLSWALSLGTDFSGIREIDLFLDYEVASQLRIVGGYRWFDYVFEDDSNESGIEVEFRGPFLGLRLPF